MLNYYLNIPQQYLDLSLAGNNNRCEKESANKHRSDIVLSYLLFATMKTLSGIRCLKLLTAVVCVLTALYLAYEMYYTRKGIFSRSLMYIKNKMDPRTEPWDTPDVTDYQYYHVLLNSYMRGGSTLAGAVLGWRSDAFYVYEPLWKLSRWAYWKGNSSVCRSDRMMCRDVAQDEVDNKDNHTAGSLLQAQKSLNNIYDCQMNNFERLVVEAVTVDLGGPSWTDVKKCLNNKQEEMKTCIYKFVPGKCKQVRHIVTKVLRLTVDNLEQFLTSKVNLKIIHLFRDPRAIINSRIATAWYPSKNRAAILDNARALCDKMLIDYHEGERLKALYPNRFKFVYYEDMNVDPLHKVKLIYKYLNMDLNENKYPVVRKMAVFNSDKMKSERQKNTAFWWRHKLDWEIVKGIDVICQDVQTALGYKQFSSVEIMKNLSVPSVDIPRKYLLEEEV